jgi:hypothetical protein
VPPSDANFGIGTLVQLYDCKDAEAPPRGGFPPSFLAPDDGLSLKWRQAGAEIDLVLALPNRRLWAIEVKRSSAPKIERGFHMACADLEPEKRFVVYPGEERFPSRMRPKRLGWSGLHRRCKL